MRHRGGFGRIGQVLDAAGFDGRAQQVAQELRITSGACGHDFENVTGEWRLLRRELGHPQRILRCERLQLDPHDRLGSRAPRKPELAGRARDRKQPGLRAELARQVGQQFRRCAVHVVRVLDFDESRLGHDHRQKLADRLVQLLAPVGLGQHFDLGGGGDLDAERDRDQRQPRRQLGRSRRNVVAQPLGDRLVGVIAAEAHELAQQLAPDGVRRGGCVGLAGGVQLAEARRGVAQRFEQPSLADAGLADDFDQPAGAASARS